MIVTDAVGARHRPDLNARIVSLVPSITELLCDLGLASRLVGRTGFCIHPATLVAAIPKVGGTKEVNIDKIRRLAPTHLVVNIDENTRPTVEALAAFVPHIVVTHPLAPRDNLDLARLMGALFGADQAANAWCALFETAHAALHARPKGPPQTLVYCIWQDPWMSVSQHTYIARMLAEIGWSVAPMIDRARYPRFEWDAPLIGRIDGVLLSSEPYWFTLAHAQALERQIGKPVHLIDGEMVSWYGSRSLACLRYLRQIADGALGR